MPCFLTQLPGVGPLPRRRLRWLFAAALLWPLASSAFGAPSVVSAWSGSLSPTGIRVNAKISGNTTQVRLLVSSQADLSGARVSPYYEANYTTSNGVVSIAMDTLDAGTDYFYALEVEGQVDTLHQGRFTTPISGPMTFTFALSACAETGSADFVFDTIRLDDPLFFLHMGDLHYEDIGINTPNLFRLAYDRVLASSRQSALYRAAPIAYMWDDHDYGTNNSDRTSPAREAARRIYREYVPHYPLVAGEGDAPIYQAFSIGRVRFLLVDSRSERDPSTDPDTPFKTMLGTEQKTWLEQELLAANGVYPLIVWINTLPWIGISDDGWEQYSNERNEIADFVALNGIEGLVMLSGDAHMLAIDDGSNSDYSSGGGGAIPLFHAAALDRPGSVKGGPYSHGTFPGGGQFGLMTVEDDGVNPVCYTWSGRNTDDLELVGLHVCQSVLPPADTDGDGVDDVDDCSFADIDTWARPTPVENLRLDLDDQDRALVIWDDQDSAAGTATTYDVVTGSIDALIQDGAFDRAACLAGNVGGTSHVDESGPLLPEQAGYFLVRARNDCGSGGYGGASADDPRFRLDSEVLCPLP